MPESPDARNCPSCGEANEPQATQCRSCGAVLDAARQAVQPRPALPTRGEEDIVAVPPDEAAPRVERAATRKCPFCGETILRHAVKCRYCGEYFDERGQRSVRRRSGGDASSEEVVKWLVPIGRSGWAIASGYLGLLACFPVVGAFFGIVAVVTGILALRHSSRNPKMGGQGRAIFGIIVGGIAGLGNLVLIIVWLYGAATGWK